jgi:hypothetical protein
MGNESSSGSGGGGGNGGNWGSSHHTPSSHDSTWGSSSSNTSWGQTSANTAWGSTPVPSFAYSGHSVIDGSTCTVAETLRADNALNSTMDSSVGKGGNQISGMISALQGDVNYACATENLKENQ